MRKKKEIPLERLEQDALVTWLSYHPTLKDFYLKTNNEGKRTAFQGYNLRRMGLRVGASDLCIYYPTKTYHGLWLEVKRDKKYTPSERLSDTWVAQETFLETVKSVGYAGYFCYGFEDGKEIIQRYLHT